MLSIMLYFSNNSCCFPLHLALADVIDSYSGSTELLTIMNRLGAAISKDSLERFQVHQASVTNEMLPRDYIRPGSFYTASIDNIDKNSPFAVVYANQESRGFHGTSIQALEHAASTTTNTYDHRNTTSQAARNRPRNRKISMTFQELTNSSVFTSTSASAGLWLASNTSRPFTVDDFCICGDDMNVLNSVAEEVFIFMAVAIAAIN